MPEITKARFRPCQGWIHTKEGSLIRAAPRRYLSTRDFFAPRRHLSSGTRAAPTKAEALHQSGPHQGGTLTKAAFTKAGVLHQSGSNQSGLTKSDPTKTILRRHPSRRGFYIKAVYTKAAITKAGIPQQGGVLIELDSITKAGISHQGGT